MLRITISGPVHEEFEREKIKGLLTLALLHEGTFDLDCGKGMRFGAEISVKPTQVQIRVNTIR